MFCRAWAQCLEQHPVPLVPNSWQRQFAIDEDARCVERAGEVIERAARFSALDRLAG